MALVGVSLWIEMALASFPPRSRVNGGEGWNSDAVERADMIILHLSVV